MIKIKTKLNWCSVCHNWKKYGHILGGWSGFVCRDCQNDTDVKLYNSTPSEYKECIRCNIYAKDVKPYDPDFPDMNFCKSCGEIMIKESRVYHNKENKKKRARILSLLF